MAKKMTLEKLAAMLKQSATKNDIEQLSRSTKNDIEVAIDKLAGKVSTGFTDVERHISAVERNAVTKNDIQILGGMLEELQVDVRDVKSVLGPLTHTVVRQEERIRTIEHRLGRVERKVGLTR